jgi:ArsR family transcriptional regulator
MTTTSRQSTLQRRATVIASLAHPSRLLIVEALEMGEKTVSELTEIVGSDISTVSRHLGVLRNAGIIASRRDANRILHRLLTPCLTEFLLCVEKVVSESCGECR